MYLKLPQKEWFKKQQKQLVIWLVIKSLTKSRKFQKIHHKMIQKQLQIVMIKKFLKESLYLQKKDLRTYDNIQKIAIGQGDDYTTGCLVDYIYLKKYYKIVTIDLSKQ